MENSPKLHFLKNAEGKFYNSTDKTFYESIVNANYEKKEGNVKLLLEMGLDRFQGCQVHTITENDFRVEMSNQTTKLVLVGELFIRSLVKLAVKIPTISQVNKNLYQKCKVAIDALKPFEKFHKDFIDQKEDATDEVQGHVEEYITEMAKVEIYDMPGLLTVIKAYNKSKPSMLGTAKKVLK